MTTATSRRWLAWSLWPLGMALQASVLTIAGWTRPDTVGRAMGLMTIALLFLLVALEQILPYRRDWSIRGDRDIWRDLGHAVLYTGIGSTLAQITFLAGLPWVLCRAGFAGGVGVWPERSPFLLQIVAVMLVGDVLEYWYHRLVHTLPWLWPLHAVHHTPTRLNVLKGPRHHVVYFFGRGLLVWAPLVIVGVPPGLIAWQFAAEVAVGSLAHANIAFRIPAFVHRIIVTPEVHRIHHSSEMAQGNSNYSTVFTIWDRVFGSYTEPTHVEVRETGIDRDPVPRKFLSELVSPVTLHRLTRTNR